MWVCSIRNSERRRRVDVSWECSGIHEPSSRSKAKHAGSVWRSRWRGCRGQKSSLATASCHHRLRRLREAQVRLLQEGGFADEVLFHLRQAWQARVRRGLGWHSKRIVVWDCRVFEDRPHQATAVILHERAMEENLDGAVAVLAVRREACNAHRAVKE